jgi:hypothetical protein
MFVFCLKLPFLFLKFWFIEAPLRLIRFFFSLNHAALQVLSLPLMIRTFFKPLKNEYRKGLVWFSIGMGVGIKTVLIFVDLIIYLFILSVEVCLLALFLLWPILTIYILFI